MAEVALAESRTRALTVAVQAKVNELGWGAGGDNTDLAEYIILMLSSGKDQSSIATELATDLLALEADDPDTHAFTAWLFQQAAQLDGQADGAGAPVPHNPSGASPAGITHDQSNMSTDVDTDMAGAPSSGPDMHVPTGPRNMNPTMRHDATRGGRNSKRIMTNINKAMDRSHDSVLHRVRGSGIERVGRGPPSGPRGINSRAPRPNGRIANFAHAMQQQQQGINGHPHQGSPPHMNPGVNMNGGVPWMMPGAPPQPGASTDPNQIQMVAMLEQQSRLIQQLHHQQQIILNGNGNGPNNQTGRGGYNGRGGPRNGTFRGGRGGSHHHDQSNSRQGGPRGSQQSDHIIKSEAGEEGEDTEMPGAKRETLNPDDVVCKYNLRCANKDCKFAHQSPAAPPGASVDVTDSCTFGAACKNKKCVGRHPSPATRAAHQSEQNCKYYPNCANPNCAFRHPPPPCRNGGDCTVPNCKFTHLDTMCKFRPCTNRFCKFKHEDGQRGSFQDKVWVAGGSESGDGKEHVSDRKFVDEAAGEEMVVPDYGAQQDHDVALEAIR